MIILLIESHFPLVSLRIQLSMPELMEVQYTHNLREELLPLVGVNSNTPTVEPENGFDIMRN